MLYKDVSVAMIVSLPLDESFSFLSQKPPSSVSLRCNKNGKGLAKRKANTLILWMVGVYLRETEGGEIGLKY